MNRIYFDGNWHGYVEIRPTIYEPNVVDATIPVRISAYIGQDSGYAIDFGDVGAYLALNLGSETKYLFFREMQLNGNSRLLGTVDFTLKYNDDGSISNSLGMWSNKTAALRWSTFSWGELTHTMHLSIPRINRSGVIESVSPNAELGKPITVTIKDREEGLEHQVWWKAFGGDWVDLGKKAGNVFTFTPNRELHTNAGNSDTGKLDISVRTFKDGKQYGGDVYKENIPIKIPSDIKPKISDIRFTDNYTKQKKLNIPIFLQDLSDIDYEIVTAADSITEPTEWHLTIENTDKHFYGKTGKLGQFTEQGEILFKAWAVDKRGRESDVITKTVIVNRYKAPQLSFVARRSGAKKNTVTVTTTAKVAPLTNSGRQYNSFSLEFYTRRIEDTQFIKNEGASLKSTSTYELIEHSANLNGTFNSEQSYMIKAVLRDAFREVEYLFSLSTEQVVASYSQWGMGIGKIWEHGSLDVAGDVYVGGYIAINGNQHSIYLKGDANTMTRSGLFYVDNLKNAPYHAGYLTVHSHTSNDRYVLQEFTPFNSLIKHIRKCENGTWSEWTNVWKNATYLNGWKDYSSDYQPVQYKIKNDGSIELRGSCKGGNATPWKHIFKLPKIKIEKQMFMRGITQDYKPCMLAVYDDGTGNGTIVVVRDVNTNWLCFDGITINN